MQIILIGRFQITLGTRITKPRANDFLCNFMFYLLAILFMTVYNAPCDYNMMLEENCRSPHGDHKDGNNDQHYLFIHMKIRV